MSTDISTAASAWIEHEVSPTAGPLQIIFSSHGVPEGSFEFKSQLTPMSGERIYLNTPAQDLFMGGVPGFADDFAALIEQLKTAAGDREVIVMGAGPGGFAAIRCGAALSAKTVLAFSPIINLDAPLSPGAKIEKASEIEADARDLSPLIETATETRFILISAEWDIFHMRWQSELARLSNVSSFGLLNVNTSVPATLRADDVFARLYERILRGDNRHLGLRGVGPLSRSPDIAVKLFDAKIAASTGDWATAHPMLEDSADALPDCEVALEQLGAYHMTQGNREKALDYYAQCAEMNTARALYRDRLNKLIRSLQIKDPRLMTLAGMDKPETAASPRQLGDALMVQGDFLAAAEAFHTAVEANSEDIGAALGEVNALRRAGQLSDAGRAMRRLIKADPKNHTYQHNMGVILLKSGDPRRALTYLGDAFDQEPRNPGYAHQYSAALFQTKKPDEALKVIEVAVQERPENPGFQFTKAEIAMAVGAHLTAEEAAAEAVRLMPEKAPYNAIYANALSKDETRITEAVKHMRIALTLDFDNGAYKQKLADMLRQQGNTVEADLLIRS